MRANVLLLVALLSPACRPAEPMIRHYREIAVAPPPPAAPASLWMWTTPDGWTEKESTGLRAAAFAVGEAECTIVSFPGDSGGLAANIRRWLGQLNESRTDGEIEAFIERAESFTTEGGWSGLYFDFAELLPEGAPTSLLASVVRTESSSIFVKLTGQPALLAAEKDRFLSVSRSLRPRR